jgi:anti-anti-sigma factor
MAEGKIWHATYDGVHVLRFVGDVRYPLSPSLDHFLQNLFSREEAPEGFVIDLTETRSIDSTNLGLMVRIAKFMQRLGKPRVTIISDRQEINQVLMCLGFDKVFDIVKHSKNTSPSGKMLTVKEVDSATLSQTLLDAHRTLMTLNERNKELFRDVVALLAQEQADKSASDS